MKKRLVGLITVILAAIMATSVFSGCDLVTKNNTRDLGQVVATVNVNERENGIEKIYKKDMIMSYLNYGYIYVQYYGYSAADTYGIIINNLIDNRIIVQAAYAKFEEDAAFAKNADKTEYTPERYLNEEETTDAVYSTRSSVKNLLKSFVTEETAKNSDTLIEDVRTVPTGATNAEKEVDKAEFNAEPFDLGSDKNARKSFNSLIELLKNNELLGDDYAAEGTIESTLYYKELLKSNLESKVIEKYEDYIEKTIYSEIDFADLEAAFNAKLEKQQKWTNAEFVSALSSASASDPILYSGYGTYGYVYNLLIGVSDEQSAKISDLQEKRTEENLSDGVYEQLRAEILADTLAKDLRSTWILSGYDFDGEKFTGDYTFAKDAENSLAFQGVATELAPATDDENAVYGVESVKTFGLDKFIEFINDYIYGAQVGAEVEDDDNIYWAYQCDEKPEEYDAKINELLFAFSTDSGSLNTYKGYAIEPLSDNEKYVKTFANAGRALLLEGGASYKVVASDYGYHFMFFSEVFNAGEGYESLSDYLDTLGIDMGDANSWAEYFENQKDDWKAFKEENNYLYVLANEIVSAKLSDATTKSRTELINKYRYEEKDKYVVVYEDRYADLLG